ncbi:MAG: tyrosine-type recombinase/integrase [Clostridia bacterium]|nr:tyrosine-type recombinase/integrase [Clostridia bacterium]
MVVENICKVAGHLRIKNGYWQMILSYKDKIIGKRVLKSKSTGLKEKGNKKRAESMLSEAKNQLEKELEELQKDNLRKQEDKKNPNFTDFLKYWLSIIKSSIEITTYAGYNGNINKVIIPYFEKNHPNLKLSSLTPKHIQDFYAYKMNDDKVSSNTVIHYHANIRKALQYTYKNSLINSNPADKVERPKKVKFTGTMYNSNELNKLFELVKGERIELAVVLGAFYGLRRSEIVGLKWQAINFEKNTITISHTVSQCVVDGKFEIVSKDRAKTKSSHRTLPLVPHFKKVLLDLKKKQEFYREVCGNCYSQKYLDYVYVNELGNLIKPDYITSRFKHIVTSNKLKPLRFHDLRHSCASLLYENGVSLKNIQEWLGHSQLSTTSDIYTHLDYKSKISSANAIMGLLS